MSKKLPSTSTDNASQTKNDPKKPLAWPKPAAPDDPIFTRGFQFGIVRAKTAVQRKK